MQNLFSLFKRDLQLRGYSPKTCKVYTSQIEQFFKHCNCSNDVPDSEGLKVSVKGFFEEYSKA
jgi:integrase/recombinase XerD